MTAVPNSSMSLRDSGGAPSAGACGADVEEFGPRPASARPGGPRPPEQARSGSAAGPTRRALAGAARAGRAVRWYVTNLMGDTAYATYVAHHRRHHPDEPALTERQFWRQRMDDQDRNPGARCC